MHIHTYIFIRYNIEMLQAQLDAVLSDIGADAIKTGMIPSGLLAKVNRYLSMLIHVNIFVCTYLFVSIYTCQC
jgi:hydroxymethylpyrimidine/phosphomethylpyrimidine kinase